MKGKGAGMGMQRIGARSCFARLEGAKSLADFAVLDAALHRKQGLRRMVAQRARERDLVLGGKTRSLKVGCAEFLQQLACEALDHGLPVHFRRLGDDSKRGPAETIDTKKARAQRHALFLAELGRV